MNPEAYAATCEFYNDCRDIISELDGDRSVNGGNMIHVFANTHSA